MDIETLQLNLLVRTFQIRALGLLKVFAPRSTLVIDILEHNCTDRY